MTQEAQTLPETPVVTQEAPKEVEVPSTHILLPYNAAMALYTYLGTLPAAQVRNHMAQLEQAQGAIVTPKVVDASTNQTPTS